MPVFILTYHRLIRDGSGTRDFYDVPAADLGKHLDALQERKITPLDLHEVPDGNRPGYLLTFDDGTRDHFEIVAPLLRDRGARGIFFVPTAKIGTQGRVTSEEVRALSDAGHEIGCHSHDHIRLDTLDAAAVRTQLSTAVAQLRAITGRETRWFAPPGGFCSAHVRQAAAELGLHAVRTMRWGRNDSLRLDGLECLPLNRSITPKRFGNILDGYGLSWLKALYFGKQALKTLLPLRTYERARAALFRRPA